MAATPHPLAAASSLLLLQAIVLLGLLSSPTAAEQSLVAPDRLQAGRTLFNKARELRFIMQWNCDLVLYEHSNVLWASDTGGNGSACHAMLDDFNRLVVQRGDGQLVYWSPTSSRTPQYLLVLQSDRNIVIYSSIAWSTGTQVADHGGLRAGDQVLLQNGKLRIGEYLSDDDLKYQLLMQADCDLALYEHGFRIWSTGTAGRGTDCTATLTADGQLVIRDGYGSFVKGTGKGTPFYGDNVLLLLPDRRVVLANLPVWESKTSVSPKAPSFSGFPAGNPAQFGGLQDDAAGKTMINMVTERA